MQHLHNYIFEKFITLFSDVSDYNSKHKYSKEVYNIVQKSYEYIGGLAGCDSYEDFVEQYVDDDNLIWKLVLRNNKITAIRIYSTKRGGRKGIVMASDGTEQGKKDISKILEEDYKLKDRHTWGEVSGKALGAALNNGAIPLPNYLIFELMPDKDKTLFKLKDDGWFYDRKIAGKWHTKLLIGYPPSHDKYDKPSKDLISNLKELSKKYES